MIKVLFLASNPTGQGRLDLNREYEVIKEKLVKAGLAEAGADPVFELVKEDHVTLNCLVGCILKHKPDIVHFGGHGDDHGSIYVGGDDVAERDICGGTVLGRAEPVARDTLGELFRNLARYGRGVRCVVLNACYTDESADAIAESVHCVVGMKRAIGDSAAIRFAAGFYQAVAAGCSVQAAVALGRIQIDLDPRTRPDEDLPWVRARHVRAEEFVLLDQIPPAPPAPLLHGKYHVVRRLPPGLISRIDIALDVQLERRVVIKTLTEPAAREAFEREALELARVAKHPNIVSVYGAWLEDDRPHYVREYIDGHSLQKELFADGRPALPIDFVHQVLAALGDAMLFASRAGVPELGIDPEKVLIQKRNARLRLGRPSSYNILFSPASGGSEYIRDVLPGRLTGRSRLYVPPEYFRRDRLGADEDRANQYRLGIIGYEMLIGSEQFRQRGTKLVADPENYKWPSILDRNEECRCPTFLRVAIERMIQPNPRERYDSLAEAVEKIAHRNLSVEVARDSLTRILGRDANGFFHQFYTNLFKADVGEVFLKHPKFGKRPPDLDSAVWKEQYNMLLEAIYLLFAFKNLKEDGDRTVLSPVVAKHNQLTKLGLREDYYDRFGEALVETVLDYDKGGNYPDELATNWHEAIKDGLQYLKGKLQKYQNETPDEVPAAPTAPDGGPLPAPQSAVPNGQPPPATGTSQTRSGEIHPKARGKKQEGG
jgi:serine/threonine protein kinase